MRTTFFVLVISIVNLFYSLRFGYLLTGYAHGGQLLGLPFGFFVIIISIIASFWDNTKTRRILNIIAINLLLAIFLYSVITEIIIKFSNDYFEILYEDNKGISGKLFIWIFGISLLTTIWLIIQTIRKPLKLNPLEE